MPVKRSNLIWPHGGVVRAFAFQSQPPFSTYSASNVRPRDPMQKRLRGGPRPGLDKAFAERMGTADPHGRIPRLLSRVRTAPTDGYTGWGDPFYYDLGMSTAWAKGPHSGIDAIPDLQPDGLCHSVYKDPTHHSGVVLDLLTPALDVSQTYVLGVYIVPHYGTHPGAYSLYAGLHDTSPNSLQMAYRAVLDLAPVDGDPGDYGINLSHTYGGDYTADTDTGSYGAAHLGGWFVLSVADEVLKAYYRGTLIHTKDWSAEDKPTGTRLALSMAVEHESAYDALIDAFQVNYYTGVFAARSRTIFVGSAGGKLYRDESGGALAECSPAPDLTLTDKRTVLAQEHLQRLFIADHDDISVSGTDGVVAGGAHNELDAVSVPDWTDLDVDINTHDYLCWLTNGIPSSLNGMYEISAVAAGNITLDPAPGDGDCTFHIQRAPKVFDPVADTLALWLASAGKGVVPKGCNLIALFNDRIVLAGGKDWYMSRQGDAYDWLDTLDYSDLTRPISGNAVEAGKIGEDLTALMPFVRGYLLFGSREQIWKMRGDPAAGGRLDIASPNIGVLGATAWCMTPDGFIVFMGNGGLYGMAPAIDSHPEPISPQHLPVDLADLDPDYVSVSLAYDTSENGINIFCAPYDLGPAHYPSWFLDWATKRFWRVSHTADHEVLGAMEYPPLVQAGSRTVMACRDGYVRRYLAGATYDDGTELTSYVFYGPLKLDPREGYEGYVVGLEATVSAASAGNVSWALYVADTPEALQTASAVATGTWVPGVNPYVHLNWRGVCCAIKVHGTRGRWAMEHLVIRRSSGGPLRVA